VRDRFEQAERSMLLRDALQGAGLGWTIEMTRRIHHEYQPRGPEPQTLPAMRLVDAATAVELTATALQKIRRAAETGELMNVRHLLSNLFRWRNFAGNSDEVRKWTDARLSDGAFILKVTEAVTGTSWVTSMGFDGMGDRVSRGVPNIQLEGLESILNVERFLARVTEIGDSLVDDREKQIVARFRDGMRRREEEEARRRSGNPRANNVPGEITGGDLETEILADAMANDEHSIGDQS
jgi:hypothetical protein